MNDASTTTYNNSTNDSDTNTNSNILSPETYRNDEHTVTDTLISTHAAMESAISATATVTITETATAPSPPVLNLTLRPAPRVSWDENVENNEGLGRKSSKRCCIFHKERPFGESSTDSSDSDGDSSNSSEGGFSTNKPKKIVRPKQKKVPDFQRFHA
uniref:Type 1 phosphatases regulator n=1 Tax=Eucampia antarctica TaxID=49252 RepID=A0A7S2R240_9STRA|mmetsp:Transcript_14267/g.13777  ORF Transcript_14267/g.13777 Transcript_14267/m.13777 type:complete len:158 (+) Transcript_14267:98-571(+)|eukprot:CAMPEP_0197826162 /NCGR_PEP_ID=MMETSP1437-20131217/3155_1 /TAXON_ID=49252 ORGANISM="Eucampia antarctica, Strain CCMP1452" /NCGR_SAMPLE_ID=MMETSP1437 /ASSEMBLY_ACC=CAM_ASM_001096 /LENGTH=157 /DNA_ID=CAMNT_0043426475 /DNA_START=92 /DNA_END=568 /DNA_ORIENTATION=-